jgi:hypothetical protein
MALTTFPPSSQFVAAVDLNGPGHYLHWSIITVSVANLILVAVMVVVFGAALLLPFPGHTHARPTLAPDGSRADATGPPPAAVDPGDPEDAAMWTARLRRRALRVLPPGRLLPDRQPAYVASWIYVFGVAAMVTLALAIASGTAIAIGGPDWWKTDAVGHFFNSMHLWSVELFMAFMVIHLWGKFWMAAWRGRRALTWITGGVAFIASIVECFTGYLSQQNFDAQWIATNGKDAVNSTGLGGFFNLMNFGQMLLWHVVLIPIVLVALVGAHVLLVRVRGVSHPLPEVRASGRTARRAARKADAAEWRGPTRRYDILKEATIATAISLALVLALAAILSSPNQPPVSIQSWAQVAPDDFLATAAAELGGASTTANYGPPYNTGTGSVQRIGISRQTVGVVRIPIDPAETFVLGPLTKASATSPTLHAALAAYGAASAKTQGAWDQAYSDAVTHVTFAGAAPIVPSGNYGPVATLLASELALARSGGIDTALISSQSFYGTNFTKPLLFLADGQYYAAEAKAQHLTGTQWGVTNETGNYPGQPWLWLYQLWYQLPGFKTSTNVDLIAIYLTGAATLLLLAVPFVPGLRNIPELVPLHRLVWRKWGRTGDGVAPDADDATPQPHQPPNGLSDQPETTTPKTDRQRQQTPV